MLTPLRPPVLVADETFTKAFAQVGRALLISDRPLSAARLGLTPPDGTAAPKAGPVLRLSKSTLPVGMITRPQWQSELTLHNDGTEILTIDAVKPSCTCMTVAWAQKALRPGEATVLRVTGTQDALGPFAHHLLIVTNQPEPAKITLQGFRETPIFLDQPALLKKVIQGEAGAVEVPIELLADVDITALKIKLPPRAPLTWTVVPGTGAQARLRVQWQAIAAPGMYRYPIEISIPDGPASVVHFYLALEVVPRVEAHPPMLLIRDEELAKGDWSRTIHITANAGTGDQEVKLAWSDPHLAELVTIQTERVGSGQLAVTVRPVKGEKECPLTGRKGSLRAVAQGAPESRCDVVVCFGKESFGLAAGPAGHQ